MTTFTWQRGRSGQSGGAGSDVILNNQLAQYAPEGGLTCRRFIIDWVFDLEASTESAGAINARSPLTLGVSFNGTSTSTGHPPSDGPAQAPGNPWQWWQGATYGAEYGISPLSGAPLLMSAHGRIDRNVPFEIISTDLWETFWLSAELEDSPEGWDSVYLVSWWQFLTAPTGA